MILKILLFVLIELQITVRSKWEKIKDTVSLH